MTANMNAGVATEEGIELREVARPKPTAEEVLVKVEAAGMNRADLVAAKGLYGGKESLGKPIGMEWAGEVIEVGSAVRDFKPGDRVMASGSGGYAEYAVSDHARTVKIGTMDASRAASLPLVILTAYDAVVLNGGFLKGQSILVQGASSAVGLMSMQIARHIGANVIAGTSSNEGRRNRLPEFGATLAVDAKQEGWVEDVLAATDGKGVDLVVDMVSGNTINQSMQCTAISGRIVNVGRLGGAQSDFDFNLHALRRIEYRGVTFRTRSVSEVREIALRTHENLWDALQTERLGLPLDRTFGLSDAKSALEYMDANAHFGKIVLIPGS